MRRLEEKEAEGTSQRNFRTLGSSTGELGGFYSKGETLSGSLIVVCANIGS